MLNLLRLEYKKFRKNSVVSMLCFFFFLFTPAGMIVILGLQDVELPPPLPSAEMYYRFTLVWDAVGYIGSWTVFFFLGIAIIYSVTAEVRYKTLRQSMINGMPRTEFYLSKFYLVLSFSIIATLYYALISLVIGAFSTDQYDLAYMFENEWAIPRFFIMCMATLSFALFIAFWVRMSGLAIFLYYVYVISIEPSLRGLSSYFLDIGDWSKYFPMNIIEDLMPMPLYKLAGYLEMQREKADILIDYPIAMGLSTIFIFIFLGLAWLSFRKRDL